METQASPVGFTGGGGREPALARPMTSLLWQELERPLACSTQRAPLSAWRRGVSAGQLLF